MKRWLVLGSLVSVGALSMTAAAFQAPAQRAPLPDATKVKDNFYVIESSSPVDRSKFTGGNVGVFITDAGVVLVDTKLADYGPDILDRIRKVTPQADRDHHQHAHARRSHGQQRGLPGDGRHRRAREHED